MKMPILLALLAGACSTSPMTLSNLPDGSADLTVIETSPDRSEASPPPACGPSPVTIDYDCGGDPPSCMVASGLEKTPCRFQDGWLVTICSQCWYLN